VSAGDLINCQELVDKFEQEHPLRRGRSAGLQQQDQTEADLEHVDPDMNAKVNGGSHSHSTDAQPEPAMVQAAIAALKQLSQEDNFEEEPARRQLVAAAAAAQQQSSNLAARTPNTLAEAMRSPDAAAWQAARQKEYDSCVEQKVWNEVDRASLPKGTNILPLKEVFKIKVDEHGNIAQFKVRFTPKGFKQKAGVDYFETFARTAMYKTERLALSLCAKLDNELVQFDVPTAFLNSGMKERVYMELPEGFGGEGKVALLLKVSR